MSGVKSLLKYRFQPQSKSVLPSSSNADSSQEKSSPKSETSDVTPTPEPKAGALKTSSKAVVKGRKAPVISSDEEEEEDDGTAWLSKETGAKMNGTAKKGNKARKRKRKAVVESESDLSWDEDEEDPFADPNNPYPAWIKNEDEFKENLKKLHSCFPGKPESLIEKCLKKSTNFYDAENCVIKETEKTHGSRFGLSPSIFYSSPKSGDTQAILEKLRGSFPSKSHLLLLRAVQYSSTYNDALDYVIAHYADSPGTSSSQRTASQESDDYVISFPAKKRARVLVSDDSFNAEPEVEPEVEPEGEDEVDSKKPDEDTIQERVGFLQEAFPNHSTENLKKVLASTGYSVEEATCKLSTFLDDDLPEIKKPKSSRDKGNKKKKKRNRYADDGDGGSLSDVDYDMEIGDESFDSEDSDLEGPDEDHPERRMILNFFNEATQQECSVMPGCSMKKAETILAQRPFEDWPDLVHKFSDTKTLTIHLLSSCKEMIYMRGAVIKLMKKCEKIAKDMGNLVTRLTADNSLNDGKIVKIMKQPKLLNPNFSLKPYQLVGLNWLLVMHKHDINGILADEMGLGKTIQAISFLAYLLETGDKGPHVIIVPSSTIDNWNREIRIWCPDMKVLLYYGNQEERRDVRYQVFSNKRNIDFHVVLTTYNMATGSVDDRAFFKKVSFHYGVIDEAHMLKNMGSQRYQSMMRIRVKRRLLLTGTPLQNNLVELMSLLAFVMPEMFENKTDLLKKMFTAVVTKGKREDRGNFEKERINHAKNIMRPFVLRRLKSQVLKQLPKKVDVIHKCSLAVEQRAGYEGCIEYYKNLKELKKQNPDTISESGAAILMKLRKWAQHSLLQRVHYNDDKIRIMSRIMLQDPDHVAADPELIFEDMSVMSDFELHKLCLHYHCLKNLHLSDDIVSDSGKFRMLDELLPDMQEKGDRILLFSQFVMVLDIVQEYMNIRGYKYCRLDGSTAVPERQQLIDTFNSDSSIFIFLLSTKAGGLGINLTAANTVILHDIDFNPYNDKQAEDRCHRVGQTRDVRVIRLLSKNTVEEGMYTVAQRKLQLEEDVIKNAEKDEDEQTDVAMILREALGV